MTWDERGKLFSNENMSMEKFNIVTGDCLWIEIGEIPSVIVFLFIFLHFLFCPQKGLVNLDFYRYIPHKNSQVDFVRQKLLEHHSKGFHHEKTCVKPVAVFCCSRALIIHGMQ